jgi:hypothetical protein
MFRQLLLGCSEESLPFIPGVLYRLLAMCLTIPVKSPP